VDFVVTEIIGGALWGQDKHYSKTHKWDRNYMDRAQTADSV